MVQITISSDVAKLTRHLREVERKQIPFATALALTATAKAAAADVKAKMPSIFNHVVPYTLNSIYVQKAHKGRLEADIHIKDKQARYLTPEIIGGPRRQKPFEWRFGNVGIGTTGYFVPGPAADLLANGNMNPGQLSKIMSDMGALDDVAKKGPYSRNRGKRKDELYVMINGQNAGARALHAGIYKRVGQRLVPVLLFVRRPVYKAIFPFAELGEASMQRHFQAEFEKALGIARATPKT